MLIQCSTQQLFSYLSPQSLLQHGSWLIGFLPITKAQELMPCQCFYAVCSAFNCIFFPHRLATSSFWLAPYLTQNFRNMSVLLSFPMVVMKYPDKNILGQKGCILDHNSCLQPISSGKQRWQVLDKSSHVTATLESREGIRSGILACALNAFHTRTAQYPLPWEYCHLHCAGLPTST